MTKSEKHSAEFVRGISEKIYRAELARNCGGNDPKWKAAAADRLIAKINDKGENGAEKFSRFAGQYDHLTRAYLEVLGLEPE